MEYQGKVFKMIRTESQLDKTSTNDNQQKEKSELPKI